MNPEELVKNLVSYESYTQIRHHFGNFVSHDVVEPIFKDVQNNEDVVCILNKLDRIALANGLLDKMFSTSASSQKAADELIDTGADVERLLAIWIDERIPKAFKKYAQKLECSPATVSVYRNGNHLEYGLVFAYEKNYDNLQETTAHNTNKFYRGPLHDDPLTQVLSFGKYKGCTFEQIFNCDRSYLQWMSENIAQEDVRACAEDTLEIMKNRGA